MPIIIIGIIITTSTVIATILIVTLAPGSESLNRRLELCPRGPGVGKGVVLRGCSQLGDFVLNQALGFRV